MASQLSHQKHQQNQKQWSLTTHLLTTNASLFTSATQHPFLLAAAHGTLPKETLSRWLANDRLYIHSYIRAAGKLLESIELPIELDPSRAGGQNLETRLVDWLIEALVAVRREERMFLDVAERYGLDLGIGHDDDGGGDARAGTTLEGRKGGRGGGGGGKLKGLLIIQDCFRNNVVVTKSSHATDDGGVKQASTQVAGNTTVQNIPWLEGAVTFWGTERCYLDAWSWAKSNEPESKDVRDDADGGALRKEFIPNWSSEGFREFVERLGRLIDEAVGRELDKAQGDEEREEVKKEILERVEARWKTLLEGEKSFWPDV